jgi:hypothetical protein
VLKANVHTSSGFERVRSSLVPLVLANGLVWTLLMLEAAAKPEHAAEYVRWVTRTGDLMLGER